MFNVYNMIFESTIAKGKGIFISFSEMFAIFYNSKGVDYSLTRCLKVVLKLGNPIKGKLTIKHLSISIFCWWNSWRKIVHLNLQESLATD